MNAGVNTKKALVGRWFRSMLELLIWTTQRMVCRAHQSGIRGLDECPLVPFWIVHSHIHMGSVKDETSVFVLCLWELRYENYKKQLSTTEVSSAVEWNICVVYTKCLKWMKYFKVFILNVLLLKLCLSLTSGVAIYRKTNFWFVSEFWNSTVWFICTLCET